MIASRLSAQLLTLAGLVADFRTCRCQIPDLHLEFAVYHCLNDFSATGSLHVIMIRILEDRTPNLTHWCGRTVRATMTPDRPRRDA